MATVIDSLLVTLGLDSKPYKKGAADAERSQKNFRDNTKKTNNELSASVTGLARQIGLLVLGFESLRGAVGFLTGINNADAALGRLAANTGTNVRELNEWALAVELAGGSVDDAKADVTSLASSITDLKATGTVSPLLLLMQRLGVAIFDAEGRTRDLFDILNDAGGKLRQFNRADAFQLAKGAGISEGTLNLLLLEEEARKRIFAQAAANNNMDLAAAERAAELQRQWRDLAQGARAFGRELLETITPAALAFADAIKPAGDALRSILSGLNDARVGEAFATAINATVEAIAYLVEKLPAAQAVVTSFFEYFFEYADKAGRAVADVVEGIGKLKDAVSLGIGDAVDFLTVDPTPNDGAARAPSTLARNAQAARLAAYNARQANAAPGGSTNTTTVQIDQVTVNTAATDAEGIAADLPAALRRKGVVAQADTGMN